MKLLFICYLLLTLTLTSKISRRRHQHIRRLKITTGNDSLFKLIFAIGISADPNVFTKISSSSNKVSISEAYPKLLNDYKETVTKEKKDFKIDSFIDSLKGMNKIKVENLALIKKHHEKDKIQYKFNEKVIKNGLILIISFDIVEKKLVQVFHHLVIKDDVLQVYENMKLKSGINLESLNSLKKPRIFLFYQTEEENQYTYDIAECSICLGNDPNFVTTCNHNYHDDCLKDWIKAHDSCPMCRYNLSPNELKLLKKN